jgi:hypothetical protein
MNQLHLAQRLTAVILAGALAACGSETTAPTAASTSATAGQATLATANATTVAATLRVRCEARRNSRSKISVDGFNVSPRNGSFRARVRAAGGSVTSPVRRAIGDQVEFDFDSDRGDIARGATQISARFIVARSGPDVIGELLNSQGRVVASRGVDCQLR